MSPKDVSDLLADLDRLAAPDQWDAIERRAQSGNAGSLPDPVPTEDRRDPTGREIHVSDFAARRPRPTRVLAWTGAAAAAIAVLVGIVGTTNQNQSVDTRTADKPGLDEDVGQPAPTPSSSTTPGVPEDQWAFDITYIDVDAGHSVASSEASAWVAGTEAPILSKIDLATNTVASTTEIAPNAGNATFGFGAVWITHRNGTVSRFEPETETVVATLEVGGEPFWIESGTDSIWVTTGPGNEIVRIDPATNTITARIDTGRTALVVAENQSGLWVTDGANQVTRIDPTTNTVEATITLDGSIGLTAGPDDVWATGFATGIVYRIDSTTNAVIAEIDIAAVIDSPVLPQGVHFADGTVWIRYGRDCDQSRCGQGVARIDPATNEVVATADLRPDWGAGGMSAGPTTAWTFDDNAVARFDFGPGTNEPS
jgi:streptogramin lyase